MIRVLLVDDHTLVREGLCRILEDYEDISVVGEAYDGQEALRMVQQLQPDVMVMDISMPGLDGIEATKWIVREKLKTRILILTMYTGEEYAVRLLQAGARGFIGKGALSLEVVKAIRKVAAGGYYLPLTLSEKLSQRYAREGTGSSPLGALSDRELEVFKRLAKGHTGREIAQELHLSIKTVDTYRARLLAKLDLHTRADLVRFALRWGMLSEAS